MIKVKYQWIHDLQYGTLPGDDQIWLGPEREKVMDMEEFVQFFDRTDVRFIYIEME